MRHEDGARRMYYEDVAAGDAWSSPARTITETDTMSWSYMTGDWTSLHVDEEYAKAFSPFGTRVPPGMMTAAIAQGLLSQLRLFHETALAFLELVIRYRDVVRIGDTVHAELSISEKRLTSKGDRGIVRLEQRVLNQHGTVVQDGEWVILVARRPDAMQPASGD
jgi:acyl dehydratase